MSTRAYGTANPNVATTGGLALAAAWVVRLHLMLLAAERQSDAVTGFSAFANTIVVDRFAIYFFYLFLAGAVISVIGSGR